MTGESRLEVPIDIGLDRLDAGKLLHRRFDEVLAALAMHTIRMKSDARLAHSSAIPNG